MTEKEPIIVQSTIKMKPEELQTWQKRVAEQIERDGVCVLPPYLEVVYPKEQEPCETSTDEPMAMVYPTIFCDDAISREAVLKIIDGWYEQNRDTENIEDLIILITYMSSVQTSRKGCRECENARLNGKGEWGCGEWVCNFKQAPTTSEIWEVRNDKKVFEFR